MLIFAAAGDVLDVVVGWGSGGVPALPFFPSQQPKSPAHLTN